jgi:hypothetical protein
MNVSDNNTLMDDMMINLNKLGALMLDRVSEEVEGTGVIIIDQSGPRQGIV